jgi:sugar O-acyltransferase (sialic acid O-acetyltransferase NeuD family)
MNKIAIFGAGGFGKEVAWLIEDISKNISKNNGGWKMAGFFDDKRKGQVINGYKVLGGIEELNDAKEELFLVVAVGDPTTKKNIVKNIRNPRIKFPVLVHPSVVISDRAKIGEGSIICAGNIISVDARIGRHVIINLDCTIGHDAIIGDFCSFMPSVNISGETKIEEGTYFGTGALIINQKKVGKNVTIGAGSAVFSDIPDDCTALGNPARLIKMKKDA